MFESTHKLDFEVAEYEYNFDDEYYWIRFRIGTCEGVWCSTDESYIILCISNNEKGNGHLQDVFDWFEQSCKRDGKNFKFLEVWNQNFKNYLIQKQGFKEFSENNLVKSF